MFEELDEGGYIISGTARTVRDKLRVVADELRAGIVRSGMNGGSQGRRSETVGVGS